MINRKILLGGVGVAALIGLGACNNNGGSGSNTAANFSDAVPTNAFSLQPGQYETTVRVSNVSLQGFTPQQQSMATQVQNQPQVHSTCIPVGISAEMIRYQNVRFTIPAQAGSGGCNLGDITLEGGNLHGAMNCQISNLRAAGAPSAVTINAHFSGTYQANTMNMTGHGDFNLAGQNKSGGGDISISMRRTGDCTAPMPMPVAPMSMTPESGNAMGSMDTNATDTMTAPSDTGGNAM